MSNKPMFPLLKGFMLKMQEKKVREKAVDRLGDAVLTGGGQALGQEAGKRVTRRIRPGRP